MVRTVVWPPADRWGRTLYLVMAVILCAALPQASQATDAYRWRSVPISPGETLAARVPPPAGFWRKPEPAGSFADWLRGLPMKDAAARVHYFDGRPKPIDVHAAVVDIDVGKRDLQQCADAIMRLRAEWQLGTRRRQDIGFDFTGGGRVEYLRWAEGGRPSPDGRTWRIGQARDESYAGFRKYMDLVFAYAGTMSLERELAPVAIGPVLTGDVIIKGGFPGHAVLVADMAIGADGERRYLLVQSYMPAQEIHVLIDPSSPTRSPWYRLETTTAIVTPEWSFAPGSVRRWRR
jgi:hypothetical protein